MIFSSIKHKIRIHAIVEEPGYDLVYERKLAEDNNTSIRANGHNVDVNKVYLKKTFIPDIMVLSEHDDYATGEIKSVSMHLNHSIYIHFDDIKLGQFWFMILTSTDFEGKTLEELKEEFPEDFI